MSTFNHRISVRDAPVTLNAQPHVYTFRSSTGVSRNRSSSAKLTIRLNRRRMSWRDIPAKWRRSTHFVL